MLVDANLLIYASVPSSPHHEEAAAWWIEALGAERRVAIPWQTIGAFLRLMTNPRIFDHPISGPEAWSAVEAWLEADPTWIPPPSERTARLLGRLIQDHYVTGNLVPDAMLAALAIEHGLTVMSADSDFARFPEVSWVNPLVP